MESPRAYSGGDATTAPFGPWRPTHRDAIANFPRRGALLTRVVQNPTKPMRRLDCDFREVALLPFCLGSDAAVGELDWRAIHQSNQSSLEKS